MVPTMVEMLKVIDRAVAESTTVKMLKVIDKAITEYLDEERAKAHKEGYAKGHDEGHDEGLSEGYDEGIKNTLQRLVMETVKIHANLTPDDLQEFESYLDAKTVHDYPNPVKAAARLSECPSKIECLTEVYHLVDPSVDDVDDYAYDPYA